jgi:hypothetical protein
VPDINSSPAPQVFSVSRGGPNTDLISSVSIRL